MARLAAARGAHVVCVGRRPGPVGEHRPWDARGAAPPLGGVDAVVHLAAAVGDTRVTPQSLRDFAAVNVAGGARLLEAAGDRPVVWVSSASVYDPRLDRRRVREDHPLGNQLTAYGRTKAAGDVLARRAGAVVLRPHAVYGTGDRHLLPRLRAAVRRGRIVLPGGDVALSLTHVENLAEACLEALTWPRDAYNVADASPYRRDEVVAAALAVQGRTVRVSHLPLPAAAGAARLADAVGTLLGVSCGPLTPYVVDQLGNDVVLDITRALSLGWYPRWSLADHLPGISPPPPR